MFSTMNIIMISMVVVLIFFQVVTSSSLIAIRHKLRSSEETVENQLKLLEVNKSFIEGLKVNLEDYRTHIDALITINRSCQAMRKPTSKDLYYPTKEVIWKNSPIDKSTCRIQKPVSEWAEFIGVSEEVFIKDSIKYGFKRVLS